MNEKQQKWINGKIEFMKMRIETNWPLSDEQWDSVADYIEKVVNLSKGNAEVRSALFDVIEPYQIRAEEILSV